MNRRPVVGMSLKNYLNTNSKTAEYCQSLRQLTGGETKVEQFLFPSLGALPAAQSVLQHRCNIAYGAQNIASAQNGTYTGEYSIETLLELGGSYVEIGHHERIQVFHETSTLINQKIRLTLACNCTPIVCIDEGNQKLTLLAFRNRLTKQLTSYLHTITPAEIQQIIFAYEPGWAIGQKEAAPAEFVHTAHQALREIMAELFATETAERVRLIYGGSVSKESAGKIIANADVDGVFIGRFGHEPRNYQAILELVKTGGEQDDN